MSSRVVVTSLAFSLLLACCAAPSVSPETTAVFGRSRRAVYPERPRIPWQVGQWVLLRVSESSSESIFRLFGYPSAPLGFRRIAITGREGTAYRLDYREVSGGRDLRLALLVDDFDAAHLDRLRLRRVTLEPSDGRSVEVPLEGEQDDDIRGPVEALMAGLHFIGHEGRPRDITVPAGTFESTNAVPISFSTTLGAASGYVMYTNAVPVLYYAKRVTRRTSAIWFQSVETVELVDFGLTGAGSSSHP